MLNIWPGRNLKALFAAYFFLYSLACIASNAYATSSIVSHNANYTLSMGKGMVMPLSRTLLEKFRLP